jgi:hypothetical protein
MRRGAGGAAGVTGKDLSEYINDLHVWFRSFRAKLSLSRVDYSKNKRLGNTIRGLFRETVRVIRVALARAPARTVAGSKVGQRGATRRRSNRGGCCAPRSPEPVSGRRGTCDQSIRRPDPGLCLAPLVRFASIPTVKNISALCPSWIRSTSKEGDSPPLSATITTASRTQNSTPRRVVNADPILNVGRGQRKGLRGGGVLMGFSGRITLNLDHLRREGNAIRRMG